MKENAIITICEIAFSIQNVVKNKYQNNLQTKNFNSVIRVAMEGLVLKDCDPILLEAMSLSENFRKFTHLYSRLELYLSGDGQGDLEF